MRTRFAYGALLASVSALAAAGFLAGAARANERGALDAGDPKIADVAAEGDSHTVREMLRRHVDSNVPGRDGTPALHWIVRLRDLDTAKQLLRAGADANGANRYGVRPLHIAIAEEDLAMVQVLLQAHADPALTDAAGETPLMMAAKSGQCDIVKLLLDKKAQVDTRDPEIQQTALMFAARGGHTQAAQVLIAHGANVNAQTRAGKVPAFRTPASNTGSRGVGIIRGGWPERGARDPVPGAKTGLLYAVREGHLDTVRVLLDAGANIEQADANGVTPLIMAILNNRIEVAQLLVHRGANANASDWYGETALWAAVDLRDIDVPGPHITNNGVDQAAAFELIKQLLEVGADVNARTKEYPPERRWITTLGSLAWVDFTGQTPFLRAAYSGDIEVMHLLLDHLADPNIATFGGTTSLMAAAGVNWTYGQTYDEGPEKLLEAVKLAQSLGNDVNAVNSMGVRAIHGAANRGSDDVIRFLVDKGAFLDVADKQGRTAMTWAQGVFLATNPPVAKPTTVALIKELQAKAKTVARSSTATAMQSASTVRAD
jgi:ankyrin repeat protein